MAIMDKTMRLPDGRTLGYVDCGNPDGKPVFIFHGFPCSRLDAKLVEKDAISVGIRIICADRPGMGLSDFQPDRQILDWTKDVVALAASLGIERFAVVGGSGGGPYALACAYGIPDVLTACGIVGGLGPIDLGTEGMSASYRAQFFVAQRLPWLIRLMLWLSMGRHIQDLDKAERMMSKIIQKLPETDREPFENAEFKAIFLEDIRESFRQGTRGPSHEFGLYGRPWGFRLEDISFDRVYLWYGELDKNTPASMGRAMADAIPKCQAHIYPNDAHTSIFNKHIKDILTTLTN